MTDLVEQLREAASKGVFLTHYTLVREAADEIERLRGVLVEANNRWRHDFEHEVANAAEKLFKKLAAHRTDPFDRRPRGNHMMTGIDRSGAS